MTKITKREAEQDFNAGKVVFLLPNKINPESIWLAATPINKDCDSSFEKLICSYSYYNCNKETGRNIAFYRV